MGGAVCKNTGEAGDIQNFIETPKDEYGLITYWLKKKENSVKRFEWTNSEGRTFVHRLLQERSYVYRRGHFYEPRLKGWAVGLEEHAWFIDVG